MIARLGLTPACNPGIPRDGVSGLASEEHDLARSLEETNNRRGSTSIQRATETPSGLDFADPSDPSPRRNHRELASQRASRVLND